MSDGNDFYEKHFDANAYLKEIVAGDDYELKWTIEEFFHRLFSERKVRGKTLLDVGCGPSIRSVISASAFVPDIYLSDLVEGNRNLVEKWLKEDSDGPSYDSQFKFVAAFEGQSEYKYLEDRVRKAIKEVFRCDILAINPLSPRPFEQFDIVTSTECIDCFSEKKDYFLAMRNLANLIKPGGYLAFVGNIECSTYRVGQVKFKASNINEETFVRAVSEAQLNICELKSHFLIKPLTDLDCDTRGLFTLLAIKS